MSMLIMATTSARGTVGFLVQYADPRRPSSSPVNAMKMVGRRGRGPTARRSATRSSAATPDALSSAPLWIARLSGSSEPIPPKPK
jgi:hypothetical protein